ncbi:MAG: heparin lyase I family protein [Acidiferrobacterales bacterium]
MFRFRLLLPAMPPTWRGKTGAFYLGLVVIFACGAVIHDTYATDLFQDGFESGNLSHTENNIEWASSASTSVNSVNPLTGSYSLQFYYKAVPPGKDDWSEQRIELYHPYNTAKALAGGNEYTDLWFKYDLYIPSNYYHRIQPNGRTDNNKFFALYRDPYTVPGFQVNFSTEPNGSGGSNIEVHYMRNGVDQTPLSPWSGRNFITSADLGHWHMIVIHIKAPTGNDTDNGVMQLWKDGKQIVDITNLNDWGGTSKNYFNAAYLLGWANSGYTRTTIFYIDNFVISTSPIGVNPPAAPTGDSAK